MRRFEWRQIAPLLFVSVLQVVNTWVVAPSLTSVLGSLNQPNVTRLSQAEAMCKDLERGFEAVKKKFAGVLAYFGEDGGMSSTDFFTTLHKFVLVSIRRFYCWLLRCPW
jgi:hypothetical protein